MSTARKVVMIIATVLVVAGAALSIGAFAAAGFDFQNLSNTRRDWVAESVALAAEAEAPHTAIVVKGSSENVRFEPADGDAIEVSYWTNADREVSVTDQDGVLSIQDARWTEFRIMIFSMGDFKDRSTVVKVPRGFTGSITVETEGSSVSASQLKGLEGVYLSSRNGHVAAAQVEAGVVELRSQNGSLEAEGVTAGRLSAQTQDGTTELSDIAVDELTTFGRNGSVHLDRVSAQRVSAESTNGTVEALALAADDIQLSTTNGSIEAVVEGSAAEYAISASSANGSVSTPMGSSAADASKRLTARSQNGHVNVSFTEEGDSERRYDAREEGGLAAPAAPAAPRPPAAPKPSAASTTF